VKQKIPLRNLEKILSMSYNITNWKTLLIENLQVSISHFNEVNNRLEDGWKLRLDNMVWTDGGLTVQGGSEGFELKAVICEKDMLKIEHIENYGEGSGTWHRNFVTPLLAQSTGKLSARLVWEAGDFLEIEKWENGVQISIPMDEF